MNKLVMLFSIPVFLGVLFCYRGDAFAEHTGPGKYNDEDLNKYETPNTTGAQTPPNASGETSNDKKSEDLETQDRESWCRRGTPIIRAISEANNELEEINNEFSEDAENVLPDTEKKERRDSIMMKIREAERALNDLEDAAREKGVPSGWIRCNFN